MSPDVRRWRERTSHLPVNGNQLYIHVPFCPFICHFCPLYKTKSAADRHTAMYDRFVKALVSEIRAYGGIPKVADTTFQTVYFGGGTPTELSSAQLAHILSVVRETFKLAADVEVTLEGVATQLLQPDYFARCREAGFSRISFGVQTLDPYVRRLVGRGESVDDYVQLVELVRSTDRTFPINVDLMAGLPDQEVESFGRDVDEVVSWGVDSVDVYSYWIVPGTRLYEMVVDRRRSAPRYAKRLLSMRRLAHARFHEQGFRQVSGESYTRSDQNRFIATTFGGGGNALNVALGFGPSAVGFVEGTMYRNISDLHTYLADLEDGRLPLHQMQTLDLGTAMRRAQLFAFQRLAIPSELVTHWKLRHLLRRWEKEGLVDATAEEFRLTTEGCVRYNQMQLQMVPFRDVVRMTSILGSTERQSFILSAPPEEATELDCDIRSFVRGSDGLWGSLRLAGYKGLLRLKQLAAMDGRAMSFSGPVAPLPNRPTSRHQRSISNEFQNP